MRNNFLISSLYMRNAIMTEEQLKLRTGKVTASRMGDVVAAHSTARRKNYMNQLITETFINRKLDSIATPAMVRGIVTEPFARAAYEIETDAFVTETGFVAHPSIEKFGASPDGLVGTDGLIEIKCPNSTTHLDFILSQKIKKDYQWQMMAQMVCNGRHWCDFVSSDDTFSGDLEISILRFLRDEYM